MKLYIRSTAAISPQQSFGNVPFLSEALGYTSNRLTAIEPDYKEWVDPKLIRRMSRVIKMGVASANLCLKDAGVQQPDAIITGTAYGCLEDTGIFLGRMVDQGEEMLSPTSFIQSTHNTVAAQIALLIHCHNYNNTFVHRGFSFESALLDAQMLIEEDYTLNVLVGGLDELTDYSFSVLSRFRLYQRFQESGSGISKVGTRGTIAGEGAAFFLLNGQPSPGDLAVLSGFSTLYKPLTDIEISSHIKNFLQQHHLQTGDIDLLITGRNGDPNNDNVFDRIEKEIFNNGFSINYKNLCGEYPTSAAFALWFAAKVANQQSLPLSAGYFPKEKKLKNILIWNHYLGIHHTLFLVSAC